MIPVEPLGHLIDYALIHARDPSLYAGRPSAADLSALGPGSFVKIGVENGKSAPEHFWAEVTLRIDERSYVGKVSNVLRGPYGLRFGNHLVFCDHHVRKIGDPG